MKDWFNITIPPEITDRPVDTVSFSVTHKPSDASAPIKQDFIGAYCYSNCMMQLSKYHYVLYPHTVADQNSTAKSILPSEEYFKWISHCQANGLVPEEAIPEHKDGCNRLTIPCRGYSRHLIYAALCCYRWVENKPTIPHVVVKLLDINKNIHFFQALHYALGKFLTFTHGNHTFLPITILDSGSAYYNTYKYGKCGYHYLPWSIAGKLFFAKNKDGKTIADEIGDNCPQQYGWGSTVGSIRQVLTKLELDEPEKSLTVPPLGVANLEHILWDEWGQLYNLSNKDDMLYAYKEVTERKKLKTENVC